MRPRLRRVKWECSAVCLDCCETGARWSRTRLWQVCRQANTRLAAATWNVQWVTLSAQMLTCCFPDSLQNLFIFNSVLLLFTRVQSAVVYFFFFINSKYVINIHISSLIPKIKYKNNTTATLKLHRVKLSSLIYSSFNWLKAKTQDNIVAPTDSASNSLLEQEQYTSLNK